MGEPLKRIDPSKELFRVQKTSDHWAQVSRSKLFLSEDFFPPRTIPLETNLKDIFANAEQTEEELSEKLIEVIPNLNHDMLIELSLYLALERGFNSKELWKTLEHHALESLHLFSLKQVC